MSTHSELLQQHLRRISTMALEAVLTEEPHWRHPDIADLYLPVRDAHPVFFGAFDWHSAVHGHWTLARTALLAGTDRESIRYLSTAITRWGILKEVATLASGVLDRYEMPYGVAWVLMLERALLDGSDAGMLEPSKDLRPLADFARRRLRGWLESPALPVENGLHTNTAFALNLIRQSGDPLWTDAGKAAVRWWGDPRPRDLHAEARPHDFLSPALEVADVVSSTLEPESIEHWLRDLIPDTETQLDRWDPVECPDPADGRSAHLLGLNLARARALTAVQRRLPEGTMRSSFERAGMRHLEVGLAALDQELFTVTHWIGTFALRALDF